MASSTEHNLAVELAKAQAASDLSPLEQALLARIRYIENEASERADEQKEYIARAERIEHAATQAYDYHEASRNPLDDEDWDTDIMNKRLEELGKALEQ